MSEPLGWMGGWDIVGQLMHDGHTYVRDHERYVVVLAASYAYEPPTCPACEKPLAEVESRASAYPWTCQTDGCEEKGASFTRDDPIGEVIVTSPADAARQALEMTRDTGSSDTRWVVYDRETGMTHHIEQEDFEQ